MMESLQYMDEVNVPSSLRLTVTKQKYKLQERRDYKALFPDLFNFIKQQVRSSLTPFFWNIQEAQPHKSIK